MNVDLVNDVINDAMIALCIPQIRFEEMKEICQPKIVYFSQFCLNITNEEDKAEFLFNELMKESTIPINKKRLMKVYNSVKMDTKSKLDQMRFIVMAAEDDNNLDTFINVLLMVLTVINY